MSTTVRQTPFTATLSPRRRSAAMPLAMRRLKPASIGFTSAISPTDSINPVNITFHEHVGPERHDAAIDERRRSTPCPRRATARRRLRASSAPRTRCTASTSPAFHAAACKRHSAFEDERHDLPIAKPAERLGQRSTGYRLELGARPLQIAGAGRGSCRCSRAW